ncbi:MAG: hypothetical protein DHS20C21_09190 [Gemmatimonadota bacterium]|nr:MAG: hypothetical protein DHS20C21_09190 [Gemmatimonadota bacterium]
MMKKHEEIVAELEELKAQIREALDQAKQHLRDAGGMIGERARRTWIAHIEMALDHDHEWMGGGCDTTMQDTLEELANAEDD